MIRLFNLKEVNAQTRLTGPQLALYSSPLRTALGKEVKTRGLFCPELEYGCRGGEPDFRQRSGAVLFRAQGSVVFPCISFWSVFSTGHALPTEGLSEGQRLKMSHFLLPNNPTVTGTSPWWLFRTISAALILFLDTSISLNATPFCFRKFLTSKQYGQTGVVYTVTSIKLPQFWISHAKNYSLVRFGLAHAGHSFGVISSPSG